MSARPCKDCGRRPKLQGRHRCAVCHLRTRPIGEQVEAAQRRLAMVPEPLRRKRSKAIDAVTPEGTSWCAGCQSFRDVEDFGKGSTRCRACASARSHAAMVEKTYGLAADGYAALLKRQGGGCAVCGGRPRSKRLAVDHDHATGVVRGLLCSRHNREALGALNDSLAMVTALWHYLNTPPASGAWRPLGEQPPLVAAPTEAREHVAPVTTAKPAAGLDFVTASGRPSVVPEKPLWKMTKDELKALQTAANAACAKTHYLPVGSEGMSGKPGSWRIWMSDDPDATPPF